MGLGEELARCAGDWGVRVRVNPGNRPRPGGHFMLILQRKILLYLKAISQPQICAKLVEILASQGAILQLLTPRGPIPSTLKADLGAKWKVRLSGLNRVLSRDQGRYESSNHSR